MIDRERQLAELVELTAEELETRARRLLFLARELRGEVAILTGGEVKEAAIEPELLAIPETEERKPKRPGPDEAVGRYGIVNINTCRIAAQVLGEFNRKQFADKTGLKPSTVSRWLSLLLAEKVIEHQGAKYVCLILPHPRDWIVHHQDEPFSIEQFAKGTGLEMVDATNELEKWRQRRVVKSVDGNGTYQYVPVDPREGPREHETKTPPENLRPSYDLAPPNRGMPVRVAATKRATRRQRSVAGAGGIKGAKQKDKRYNEMQAKKAERAEATKSKAQKAPKWQTRNGRRKAA